MAPTLPPKLKTAWKLVDETIDEFSKDRGDLLAAALAFYTLLSIAPLIIVAVAIAGFVLGRGTAQYEALRLMSETMGPGAAQTVNSWVQQASASGGIASFVGGILALLTASRLVAQLRSALNQVWNLDVFIAQGFRSTVRDYVRRRLFAFAVVTAAGPILLIVFASRAVLTGLHRALFAHSPMAGMVVQGSQLLFSIAIVTVFSAIVFRVIPDTRIGWRAVWRGALLTSLLFNVGNLLVGFYLGRATISAAYGAAGSAVVVLLWLYFSAQMFLFGAEFTQVYATHYGRGLNAKEQEELTAAERAGAREAERVEVDHSEHSGETAGERSATPVIARPR